MCSGPSSRRWSWPGVINTRKGPSVSGRLSVQNRTRPRIAGEALAVTGTAALVPQPKLKSLGRRWPPINPSRTLVSRSSMAQMSRRMQASSGRFRAGRPATGWNIDARLSQQLGLKRRGEPGVWQLACASLPVPYAFFLSVQVRWHIQYNPRQCYCCSAATLSSGGIPPLPSAEQASI